MSALARYWNTVRYLKAEQLLRRVSFRFYRPRIDLRPPPQQCGSPPTRWVPGVSRPSSLVSPDRFVFLNETRSLAARGWDDPQASKLWRYNLHYFDYLLAPCDLEQEAWRSALIDRWIRENPPGVGTPWEPFPTSLRIVNWVKWFLNGHLLSSASVESLATQARWLSRRLERHLLGNHLFANAKALIFAGLFFRGKESESWLDRGLEILAREVPEQILEDGGQFERSPMYHALALEDMLDLLNVTRAFDGSIPDRWRRTTADWPNRVNLMRRWLLAMSHPDGDISFFNDAATGIAAPAATLEAYARRLDLPAHAILDGPATVLSATGYVRVAWPNAVALLDVGEIGPDYLPAHAHADTLSFELSLFGERVFVNSGTSKYGSGFDRLEQRGTAAHNTVLVNHENSSEVWGGFRVARRARPINFAISYVEPVTVQCAHTGYHRLPGRPEHSRHWEIGGTTMRVDDHIAGRFDHAEARFHLHPSVTVEGNARASGHAVLRLRNDRRVDFRVLTGSMRIEAGTWHPAFGSDVPNTVIAVRLDHGRSRVRVDWDPST